ncbi:MAG: tRNA1(Val) (adenine(37)-N6)-methyltransferase [Microbacter sp.]
MANPYFRFKQFTVRHDRCAMKVGTDAVLLGAWAEVNHMSAILDVGTGTGILALMIAQRASTARIVAIDLDEMAISQATENVQHAPWSDRIVLKHQSWQQFFAENNSVYDLILCNPPFFQQSLVSPDHHRTIARHDDYFQMTSFLRSIPDHLHSESHFDMVYPYRSSENLIQQAASCGLYCRRQTFVKPSMKSLPTRCLLSFSTCAVTLNRDEMVIEEDQRHQYTTEYKLLTKDFYLNF